MLQYFRSRSATAKDDLLSGLTVALALVPEAIAFAFVAGVSPVIGLYSAFIIGLITACFGGRPGMISGATGAMAVVVVGLVAIHGVEYLFPAVILCGVFQIIVGGLRLGKLIRLVPHPVMLGFVNGLAIVIFLAQFGSFRTFDAQTSQLVYLRGLPLLVMLGLVALTMAIIWLLPKWTKSVPPSLVAILSVTILSVGINRFAATTDGPAKENLVATVSDMLNMNAAAALAGQTKAGSEQVALAEGVTLASVTLTSGGQNGATDRNDGDRNDCDGHGRDECGGFNRRCNASGDNRRQHNDQRGLASIVLLSIRGTAIHPGNTVDHLAIFLDTRGGRFD